LDYIFRINTRIYYDYQYILLHTSQRNIHSKTIHIITRILISSSFGVLNFMLAACR